jgi:type VI secretion system protein ImpH
VGSLFGQGPASLRHGDSVPDAAKRHLSGHLARATRNSESIAKALRHYFGVPIRVEPYVGHWMALRGVDRSRLGGARRSAALGVSAVAGAKVWDRQYKLRLHIGPLSYAEYCRFLPGQRSLIELRDWMRQLIGFEMWWDLRLVLKGSDVPRLAAGPGDGAKPRTALGWTTWLGAGGPPTDRDTLLLDPSLLSAGTPAHH